MLHGNDLTEKAVQTAKNILRTCSVDKSDVQLALLNWRNTPRNDLLGSPNQHLISRIIRYQIPKSDDNLKTKIIQGVTSELQVNYSNKQTNRPVNFEISDKVTHKVPHRH